MGKLESQENTRSETVVNVASFFIIAVGGLAFNLIIAATYGPSGAGVFNQVFAFALLFSHFSTFGVQRAALHFLSAHRDEAKVCSVILMTSLVAVIVFFAFALVVGLLISPLIKFAYGSNDVYRGFLVMLPGVLFFSANKVLILSLNALKRPRQTAIARSSRLILINVVLVALVYARVPVWSIPLCLVFGELLLTCLLLFFLRDMISMEAARGIPQWHKKVLAFGRKSFLGGALSDINTRVDILILGLFTNDALVGVYSIAAMFAEGFLEVLNIIRYIVNPRFHAIYTSEGNLALESFLKKWRNNTFILVGAIAAISIALYPFVVGMLFSDEAFLQGWTAYSILAIGYFLCSGYRVLDLIPNQLGEPFLQTSYSIVQAASNFFLNLCLIPLYSIEGAAIATALSFIVSASYLVSIIRKKFELRI